MQVGDRVELVFPARRPTEKGRIGTIIEIKGPVGLAVVRWDEPDFLGFVIAIKTLDVLRKVRS